MSFLLIHYFDLSFIKTRYTFKLTILFGGFLSICLPDKLILTTWENVTRPIQQSHLRRRLAAVLTEPLSGKVQAKIPFSFLQATSERTNTTKIGLTFAWTVFGNKFSVFQLILIYKLRSTTFSAVKLVERHSRTLTAVAGWKQNSDKTASLANVSSFRQKTSDITRVVIGEKNVLYQSTKHGDEQSSRAISQFLLCPTIFRTSLLLFFVNWKGNFGTSQPVSGNRRAR